MLLLIIAIAAAVFLFGAAAYSVGVWIGIAIVAVGIIGKVILYFDKTENRYKIKHANEKMTARIKEAAKKSKKESKP